MQITIKYSKLNDTYDFLYSLKLSGIKAVHRTRLCNILMKHIRDIAEEEQELIRTFAKKDENDEPLAHEKGGYVVDDIEALRAEQMKFLDEELIIGGGNYEKMLFSIKSIVENYEDEVSEVTGEVFASLYEQLIETE